METRAAAAPLRGVVEGFYGRPWSWAERGTYAELLGQLGLNAYLYCPKADPYLRRQWQRHWPREAWRQLRALAAEHRRRGQHFGPGLSPFALYRHYGRAEKAALRDKVRRLLELDIGLLALLFDDMPGDVPDLASRQAEIAHDVEHWLGGLRLLVCPTYYSLDPVLDQHFGARPADYLEALGAQLPLQAGVFWTGNKVCAESVSRDDLLPVSRALGRPLTLWDNYPVNDGAKRSRHLYLAPLAARDPALADCLEGHFCNPMNQAWLSLPALRGLAELYGESPATDWEACTLGANTWAALRADRLLFREQGLDGLGATGREELLAKYRALDSPAAREVVDWLQEGYRFDPDCLTD